MAQMAARACQWLGVAIETTSMSLSSRTRRRSWTNLGSESLAAETCFMALEMTLRSTSQTVVIRASSRSLNAWTCDMPRPLTPMTATLTTSLGPTFFPFDLGAVSSAALAVAAWMAEMLAASAAVSWRNCRRSMDMVDLLGANVLG